MKTYYMALIVLSASACIGAPFTTPDPTPDDAASVSNEAGDEAAAPLAGDAGNDSSEAPSASNDAAPEAPEANPDAGHVRRVSSARVAHLDAAKEAASSSDVPRIQCAQIRMLDVPEMGLTGRTGMYCRAVQ